ncbi:conserved oligomeric Golgi complex subunit 5-like isoform X2 [Rhopilema esculentum]|uniref:conserved oligomeric Golgi complex subunit 5-like isoform X2 n=1 Tax=Rhopilema esculentum TaxID=499914 RepID=UPI0031D5090A
MAEDGESLDILELLKDDGTFSKFLEDSFDPKSYANTIIQSRAIGESLAKLADGINLLDKEIRDQVSSHHEDLLSQATGIETLESVLQSIQGRIHSLKTSVERVQVQITDPYNRIASRTRQLRRLQNACDILRRVIRIFHLGKRLQMQLKAGVREIAKAAQSLNELDHVLEGEDLSDIQLIKNDLELIKKAREEVENQANLMLDQGLDNQNQTQTGTALQVFYNLGLLQDRVDEVVSKYSANLQELVVDTFDPQKMNPNQATGPGPGRSTMPTTGSSAAWRAGLWTRMDKLVNKTYELCEKVYHLEKVLAKKKDPVSHSYFIENFSEDGRSIILNNFWTMAIETLGDGLSRAAQDSTFIKQAFEGEYPKLLRICNDLWARVAQFKSNQSLSAQSNDHVIGITADISTKSSARLMLKNSLMTFETAYLSRSLSRLFDPINLVFPSGAQNVPSKDELNSIIKTMSSELNVATVDQELFILLARNIAKTVQLYVTKCEQLITASPEASQLSGGLTNAQILNAEVANSLYQLSCGLNQVLATLEDAPSAAVVAIGQSVKNVTLVMETTLNLLLDAVMTSLENKMARIHTENFISDSAVEDVDDQGDSSSSSYIKDIRNFIQRIQHDYFSMYECKDVLQESLKPVAARCLTLFVRHASLLHDISETGKMKLTNDMAQLELAVSPFCKRISDLGAAYKMLRAFRPLLFQSLDEIQSNPALGEALPYTVVLHFLFSKAPLDLRPPHIVAGWTLSEYSSWLDSHQGENEVLTLIKSTLDAYAKQRKLHNSNETNLVYDVMSELLKAAQNHSNK